MTAPAKTRPTRNGPTRGGSVRTQPDRTSRPVAAAGAVPRPRQAPSAPPRAILWLVGPNPRRAPRAPFVLLIIGLLVCGLIGLLLLNTATASASIREQSLQDRNTALTLQQQELQRDVSALDAPQALAKAAAKLGMVPGPDPAFLELLKNGTSKIIGDPSQAVAVVPPPPPPAVPSGTQNTAPKKKIQKKTPSQHRQAHGGHR